MAGGGGPGKGAGTVRVTIIQVGIIIETFHPFIKAYPEAGGMITGRADGTGTIGTGSISPSNRFKKTGGIGKGVNIGIDKKTGVAGIPSHDQTHNDHPLECNSNKTDRTTNSNIKTVTHRTIGLNSNTTDRKTNNNMEMVNHTTHRNTMENT